MNAKWQSFYIYIYLLNVHFIFYIFRNCFQNNFCKPDYNEVSYIHCVISLGYKIGNTLKNVKNCTDVWFKVTKMFSCNIVNIENTVTYLTIKFMFVNYISLYTDFLSQFKNFWMLHQNYLCEFWLVVFFYFIKKNSTIINSLLLLVKHVNFVLFINNKNIYW